jgi:hypothetical protein
VADVNLPIIPDKVIDDVRKGKSVPLERFSEAAADMRSANAAARRTPVHAESMVPISRSAAQGLIAGSAGPAVESELGISGRGMPMFPQTRRVIPAPFRRERINAERHGRTWHTCKAETLKPGDTVKGVGLLDEVWKEIRYETIAGVSKVAVGTDLIMRNAGGDLHRCDVSDIVEVHRVPE